MNTTLVDFQLRSREILELAKQRDPKEFNSLDSELSMMTNLIESVYHDLVSCHRQVRLFYDKKPPISKPCDILEPKRIIVKTIEDVQETPLFYVSSINQYAINIGGILLRGNLLDIKSKQEAKKENNLTWMMCKNHNKCQTLTTERMCPYWHDPLQLLQLKKKGILSARRYHKYISRTRTALDTSWLFRKGPSCSSFSKWMGSKSLLERDDLLFALGNLRFHNDMKEYKQLLVHDLLVCLTFDV